MKQNGSFLDEFKIKTDARANYWHHQSLACRREHLSKMFRFSHNITSNMSNRALTYLKLKKFAGLRKSTGSRWEEFIIFF